MASVEIVKHFIDVFLHLDRYLSDLVQAAGGWTYVVLAMVIFAETGLVVVPFLPGDSLLFAVGALASLPSSGLDISLVMGLLFIAAVAGDAFNYAIGRYLGPKVFSNETSRVLNKAHLIKARNFYDKHGGKAIILARFIPIIRTFAPFVAGVGQMSYRKFAGFNVIGAFCWVVPFTLLGYFFGHLPTIQKNFHYVILGIIVVSVLPALFEIWKSRQESKTSCKA